MLRRAIADEIHAGSINAYFEAAINRLIDEADVVAQAVEVAGRAWTEIDFPEDLETARRQLPALLPL
jgi:choline kinase